MASIFKRIRRNGKESKKWFIAYLDHDGKRRETVGTADRVASQRIANRLESEADLRRRGVIDPSEERYSEQAAQPIDDHVDAYEEFLESKGDTRKHIDETIGLIRKMVEGCSFKSMGDIEPNKVSAYINDLRRAGTGLATINAKIAAIKGFGRWAWRTDKTRTDALKLISKLNARTDRRHRRRALTEVEIVQLLAAAEAGPAWTWRAERTHNSEHFSFSGTQRSLLYRLCLETGLRSSEVGSLTADNLDLTNLDAATLRLDAAYSKHRREDLLPIRRDLAERLKEHLETLGPGQRMFTMPPKPAEMLKADLKAAGIPYKDGAGRVLDFHALRHTFITRLVRSGVTPAVAQKLARHSTVTLTLDHYTHLLASDERAAIDKLPSIGTNAPSSPAAAG